MARGGLSEAEQREYAATTAAASESLSTMVSTFCGSTSLKTRKSRPTPRRMI
ncbi:MAG: hypothetical protein ACLTV6_10705 [Christensenellales bacterium]